jgi:hypothetical protein
VDAARDASDAESPDFEAFERPEPVERSRLERSLPERSVSDLSVLGRSVPDLSLPESSVPDVSVRELSLLVLSVRELSGLVLSACEPSALDPLRAPAFVWLLVRRSFLAQPEPLKWIAGVVNAFVIVPSAPHSGQNRGPWSLIPWTTSVRWPQLLHM